MLRTATLILFFLATLTAQAQQPTLREFEVQQPAEPQGGIPALQQFLAVNVRKPFLAQVANLKGVVIVQGVVETDGRISEVSILKSLRPDCDREAVRAFSLFNAWKPAQHEGKAVRQSVTFPVTFRASPPILYENGLAIQHFDNAFSVIASPDSAALRSETPTDTLGLPTGNMVFFKRDGKRWKREAEMMFVRIERQTTPSSQHITWFVGHKDGEDKPFGVEYVLDDQNIIRQETFYNLDRKKVVELHRNNKGLVIQTEDYQEGQSEQRQWYNNGQFRQTIVRPDYKPLTKETLPEKMLAYWDSTGRQMVKNGTGLVEGVWINRLLSQEEFMESRIGYAKGAYEQGLKQGIWIGTSPDGKTFHEERYNEGQLIEGKSWQANQTDTLRYTEVIHQPEFKGGMPKLNQFLGQNISYPVGAQRNGTQGRVFISFVVCEDGSLCDYTVLKSVSKDLDYEALRVVKKMNKLWKPGIIRGQPVRVKYNLPINFNLY
jgi:TonB family protein